MKQWYDSVYGTFLCSYNSAPPKHNYKHDNNHTFGNTLPKPCMHKWDCWPMYCYYCEINASSQFHSCWWLNISVMPHLLLLRKFLVLIQLNNWVMCSRYFTEKHHSATNILLLQKAIMKPLYGYLFSSINNTFRDKFDQGLREATFFQNEETLICFPSSWDILPNCSCWPVGQKI